MTDEELSEVDIFAPQLPGNWITQQRLHSTSLCLALNQNLPQPIRSKLRYRCWKYLVKHRNIRTCREDADVKIKSNNYH